MIKNIDLLVSELQQLKWKASQCAYNTHSHQAVGEVEVPSGTAPKPPNTLQHC